MANRQFIAAQRAIAALLGIDYKAMRNGNLSPEDKAKLFAFLNNLNVLLKGGS